MDPITHSTRRASLIVLALALLLPLLAACGGAAVAPQAAPIPAPAEAAAGAIAAQPAAAPAAAAPMLAAATAAPAAHAPAAGAVSAQPTPPPVAASQQSAPLRAGEVDDNADFEAYLGYLSRSQGVRAHAVDVSERYVLTVTDDNGRPVLDARVRIFSGDRAVFEGRTYAGGKTLFLPRALDLGANDTQLRVRIDKGNSQAEGTLLRGGDTAPSFVLRGAQALPATPRLDVLFLLDATGSMGDEIGQIQQTIASIADRIDQITPRPALRFGLVAYRDRGDDYVTQVHDFTGDLDAFRQTLLQVSAGGGGDEPESMNEALHAAIERVSWADDAVRLTFLVADAPPHLDYPQDYDYVQEARAAVARGVKVYTVAASNTGDEAEYVMRQIAQQTLAHFIVLTYQPGQNSGAPGDSTVHQVDPQQFTVERLDDLVVQVVRRELAQAQGAA
ncbi:vWA domain-containing protein [Kouleothrix sp.]|uniref:vWA domain-containing protein n=1 Tax=Kouleothrix sp. TaxID=2779161 RepID=UPI003918BB0B